MSNEVRFSKDTVETLKKLYEVNPTLKIVEGVKTLKALNETKTVGVYAEIDEELPRTFCIYDLKEFITVLSIIDKPVVDFSNDKYVTIRSEDGSQRLKYMDGAENLISSFFVKDFRLPSEDIEVSVTSSQMKAVMDAAAALKLTFVGFKSDGKKIYFSAFDRNNGDGNDTNGFSVEVGESTDEFDMFYKANGFSILDGDCKFTISSKKISKIETGKRIFWMTLEADSEFK